MLHYLQARLSNEVDSIQFLPISFLGGDGGIRFYTNNWNIKEIKALKNFLIVCIPSYFLVMASVFIPVWYEIKLYVCFEIGGSLSWPETGTWKMIMDVLLTWYSYVINIPCMHAKECKGKTVLSLWNWRWIEDLIEMLMAGVRR